MGADEQPDRAAGSVPNAWGNAVAWRWTPDLPRPLRGAFLKLLYALRAIARADGQVRGERGAYRISQIAKASGASEKDTRRYLRAAIAAGVLGTVGEPKRGRATLYVLLLVLCPDWDAAVASLETSRPKRDQEVPPWQAARADKSSGDQHPNLPLPSSGDQHPNFEDQSKESTGHQHPYEFGGPTPEQFGGPTPEQLRSTQGLSHEGAPVVPQAEVARVGASRPAAYREPSERGLGPHPFTADHVGTCATCGLPAANQRHGRKARTR